MRDLGRRATPSAGTVRIAAVRFVVRMGDHLVGDVFLLAEQLLQTDNCDQQEGELADEQGFAHEQGERLERQHLEHGHFHHHGGHHRSHVLVFTATCNGANGISDGSLLIFYLEKITTQTVLQFVYRKNINFDYNNNNTFLNDAEKTNKYKSDLCCKVIYYNLNVFLFFSKLIISHGEKYRNRYEIGRMKKKKKKDK